MSTVTPTNVKVTAIAPNVVVAKILKEGPMGPPGSPGDPGAPGEPGAPGAPGETPFQVVEHGSDANFERPVDAERVFWSGSVEPLEMVPGDLWYDTSENPDGSDFVTQEQLAASNATYLRIIGSVASPVTDTDQARGYTGGAAYWICAAGVTPANAEAADMIVNLAA